MVPVAVELDPSDTSLVRRSGSVSSDDCVQPRPHRSGRTTRVGGPGAEIRHAHLVRPLLNELDPLGVDGSVLALTDRSGSIARVWTAGTGTAFVSAFGPICPGDHLPLTWTLRSATALWLTTPTLVESTFPGLCRQWPGLQACAALPLVSDGEILGALSVSLTPDRAGQLVDRAALEVVSDAVTVALRSLRQLTVAVRPDWGALLGHLGAGALVVDVLANRVEYANGAAQQLTGWGLSKLLAMNPATWVGTTAEAFGDDPAGTSDNGEMAVRDIEVVHGDGEVRVLEVHLGMPSADGYQILLAFDVTTRRRLDQIDSVRLLAETLSSERARLAGDLHDGVIQDVFATSIELAALAEVSPPVLRGRLEQLMVEQDVIIRRLRATVFALADPTVGGVTLRTAIQRLLAEGRRVLGFAPCLTESGPVSEVVDPLLVGHLVLALREILSNVARHACASAVSVELTATEREVHLTVRDNGIGMVRTDGACDGYGLANLQHRASVCGGRCDVTSTPGSGTTVRWSARRCPSGVVATCPS